VVVGWAEVTIAPLQRAKLTELILADARQMSAAFHLLNDVSAFGTSFVVVLISEVFVDVRVLLAVARIHFVFALGAECVGTLRAREQSPSALFPEGTHEHEARALRHSALHDLGIVVLQYHLEVSIPRLFTENLYVS